MSVAGSFRRVSGQTQPSGVNTNWLSTATREVGWNAAAVWLVGGRCPPGARLPSANLAPFGGRAMREAGGTGAESLVTRRSTRSECSAARAVGRSKRQIRWEGVEGSSIVDEPEESAEPLCAGIEGASRGASSRKGDFRPRSVFVHTRVNKKRRTGNISGFERLDTDSRPPPPWTSVLQFYLFLHDVWPWETWACWSQLIGTWYVRFVAENAGRGQAITIRVDRGCSRYRLRRFNSGPFWHWSLPLLVKCRITCFPSNPPIARKTFAVTVDYFVECAAHQTVFSVACNSDSEILAALQTVEAVIRTAHKTHREGADKFPMFIGWLDLAGVLSRFVSLLVWVAGCDHDVMWWPVGLCTVPLCCVWSEEVFVASVNWYLNTPLGRINASGIEWLL